MTSGMWAALPEVLAGRAGDPAVRVLVATGAGPSQRRPPRFPWTGRLPIPLRRGDDQLGSRSRVLAHH